VKPRKHKRNVGFKSVGDLLSGVLGPHSKLQNNPLLQILERWKDIVGPFIAERMQPIRIENNRLICFVTSSTLIQEFSFLEVDILRKLVQYAFARDIVGIRLTTIQESQNPVTNYIEESWKQREKHFQLPEGVQLTLLEIEKLESATADISDPETKTRTFRLLKAMELRKKTLLKSDWVLCVQCQSFWEPGHGVCPYCQKLLKKY
jgi:hypothetical protein